MCNFSVLRLLPFAAAVSLVFTPTVARCAASYGLSVASMADGDQGNSYNLAGDLSPNNHVTLSAAAGHSRSRADSGAAAETFSGDSLEGGVDLHSEHLGLRGSWMRWHDSNAFESITAGGGVYWRSGGLQLELLGESKDFSVDYSFVNLLGRTVSDTAKFGGSGFGAAASWYGERWGFYGRGMSYSYDRKLQRLNAISQSPTTVRLPRIQALTESVLTRGAAALDSEVSFGVDRSFARSGMHADFVQSRDAVAGLRSRDLSVSWRYNISPQFAGELTAGSTHTSGAGSVGYAGLSLSYRH